MKINLKSGCMLTALFVFLLAPHISFADSSLNICLDNNTLQSTTIGNVCVGTDCFNVSRVQNTTCQFGCDNQTGTCSSEPFWNATLMAGIIIAVIIISVGVFLAKKL